MSFRFTLENDVSSILRVPTKNHPVIPNQDTIEKDYQNKKESFERNAIKYRSHSQNQYHHHRPLSAGITLWDDNKIVDRGRGRQKEINFSCLNLILENNENYNKKYEWYDPITHDYIKLDSNGHKIKQELNLKDDNRERDTETDKYGKYDPIKCQWLINRPYTTNSIYNKPDDLDPIIGKRQYKYKMISKDEVKIGYKKKNVERPGSQGIYDPIRNGWIELPKDARIYEGLTFSPNTKYAYR